MDVSEIAKQGLLGGMLALSLTVNYRLGKMLLDEKDKRIGGAEKVRDDIAEPLKNLQKTTELIYDKIVISKEAQQ